MALTFFSFLPECLLLLLGLGTLVQGILFERKGGEELPLHRHTLLGLRIGLFALLFSYGYFVMHSSRFYGFYFQGRMVLDPFAVFGKLLIIFTGIFWGGFRFRFCQEPLVRLGFTFFEYKVLFLLSLLGGCLLLSSADLLCAYLSMELQVIPLYVAIALQKENSTSAEASFKYFVFGTLGSFLFLYGVGLLYGYGATTHLHLLMEHTETGMGSSLTTSWLQGGLLFILVGLLLKLGVFPFHMWAPDTYEGTASVQLPFIALLPKIPIFFFLIRLCISFSEGIVDWSTILSWTGVTSILTGSLFALRQDNIKRLLAYGSMSHMGYVLIGIAVGTVESFAVSIAHLIAYVLSFIGFLMIMLVLKRGDREIETISDLEGLFQGHPIFSLTLGAIIFSLVGLPPFFGFWTKFHLIMNAAHAGLYLQVGGMLIGSLLALGYYLRILKSVFLKENGAALLTAHPFKVHLLVALSILLSGAFLWQRAIFSFIGNLL